MIEDDLLHAFAPVTPALAHERALLVRCDCKFLVPVAGVRALLTALVGRYAAFRAGAATIARYRSSYLDTPDLACARDHVRVRVRNYLDRDAVVLEVKRRRDDRSEKQRLAVASATLGPRERRFLQRRLPDLADALAPSAEISYRRIGLVGIASDDRVSIDLDVAVAGGTWPYPDHAIVEVKRAHAGVASPALAVLAATGARPALLSKYVTAMAATVAAA